MYLYAVNETHIWSEILNYMNYDAVVLGNHDIEAGHNVYDKISKEVKAPILAANLIDEKTKEPYFKPYTLIEKSGMVSYYQSVGFYRQYDQ